MKEQFELAEQSAGFKQTVMEILELLHARFPLDLWMLTRVNGDDWVVLTCLDKGYGVGEGDVFDWTESFCCRMIAGKGPCIAPISDDIEAYRTAPIGQKVRIKSYVGLPIYLSNGELFGTLCAVHPEPAPIEFADEFAFIERYAAMLGRVIESEMRVREANLSAREANLASCRDSLTGLANRGAWESACDVESAVSRLFGEHLSVVMIDLDNLKATNDVQGHAAGDELICRAAAAIKSAVRKDDFLARLGGDEFGILFTKTDSAQLEKIIAQLQRALDDADASASIGGATYLFKGDLSDTIHAADQEMYANKRLRKSRVA